VRLHRFRITKLHRRLEPQYKYFAISIKKCVTQHHAQDLAVGEGSKLANVAMKAELLYFGNIFLIFNRDDCFLVL